MLPYSFIGAGTYVNPSSPVAVQVPLSDKPDWFFVRDISYNGTYPAAGTAGWGGNNATDYTANAQISSEWFSGMPAGSFLQTGQAASALSAAALYPTQGAINGFTFIDQSNPPLYSKIALTAINDSTFVVSTGATSISVGDLVRLINVTGMLQVSGLVAQVTAVNSGTSITLGYVASGVAGLSVSGNASGGYFQKVTSAGFYPKKLTILNITQASQAVVYFAQPNNFTPGELVDFTIPSNYGMSQLSFLTAQPGGAARVLSVTNSATVSSITINVDTTGFTAFAYPATGSVIGFASPATCYPAGSGIVPLNGSASVPLSPPQTNLQDAFDNRNQYYMLLGTSVCGVASSTQQWMAFKADYNNLSNA